MRIITLSISAQARLLLIINYCYKTCQGEMKTVNALARNVLFLYCNDFDIIRSILNVIIKTKPK